MAGKLGSRIVRGAIPDFILGVGFIDDAAVLAWVIGTVKTVLDDFTRWESTRAIGQV